MDDGVSITDKELLQQFNIILNKRFKFFSQVMRFYKNSTKPIARQNIYNLITNSVKSDKRNATRERRDGVRFKTTLGTNEIGAFQVKVRYFSTQMTDDTKEDIIKKTKALKRGVEGRVGFSLKGIKIITEMDGNGKIIEVGIPDQTIIKLTYGADMRKQMKELRTANIWNVASNRYYILQEIIMFYQLEGRKFYGEIDEDPIYKIYNPKSKTSCGHEILKMYHKDHKGSGSISADDMDRLLPDGINLYFNEFPIDVKDGVLLKNGHYFRYVMKKVRDTEKDAEEERLRKERTEKRLLKQEEKEKENLIFDLETDPSGNVVSIGASSNGVDYYEYKNENCIRDFVANLNCKYLIGYNSGRFDFILLRKEFLNQGWFITDYKRSCNSILRAEITKGERKIISIDLLNFTTGTLRNNLKTYNCQYAKGECDYSKICMPVSQEVLDYMKTDVMGTYELFLKLNEPFLSERLDIRKLYTLSQGGEKILKNIWKKEKYDEPTDGITPRDKDNFYREAIYGGRCERFINRYTSQDYGKSYSETKRYMDALDCNSLYPSVMRNNEFPVGDSVFTNDEMPTLMGIYKCEVIPSNRNIPVLPPYTLETRIQTLTSIDIQQGRKFGDTINVINGYVWKKTAPIYKTFMDKYYAIKKNSKKGSPQYENAKLMMNSQFGKSCQRDKNVVNYTCRTLAEVNKIRYIEFGKRIKLEEENYNVDCDDTYTEFYLEFSNPLKSFTERKSYLGAFILSFSRALMSDYLQNTTPYYTDTDSIYVEETEFNKLPLSNDLGDFSSDLKGGGKIIQALFCGKKLKACEIIYPDDRTEWIFTGKGVRNDCLTSEMYERMLRGEVVEVENPSYFLRNVKNGIVNVIKTNKKIKETDGGRIWEGDISTPRF